MMGNESEGTAKQKIKSSKKQKKLNNFKKKKVGNSVTDFFLICLSSF